MNKTIKYLLIGLVTLSMGFSQSLEESLESMAKANAQGYLGPMVTAFGMGINSGTFHNAKPHSLLGFDLKLGVSMTSITDAGKTFEFALPDHDIPVTVGSYDLLLNPNDIYSSDRTAPTMFGEKEGTEIGVNSAAAEDEIYTQLMSESGLTRAELEIALGSDITSAVNGIEPLTTPGGFDLPAVPMAVPQFSLGLPMEIELTLRGMPAQDLGDLGEFTFFGFGGKIGLNQFVPIPNLVLPRVAVGYYITNVGVGDILTMNNSIATLQVSKSIPFLTVYGGFGLESSSLEVDYTYTDELTGETLPIKFSMDGDNSFRTTVGARLKLAILSINADYNIGEFNTVNVGVGLTLR